MATTTPNYGWPVPTSTDLVKNGATAIEALGDAIDGAFVDLKGGTTGQVLAKATNTDLDYAWVTQDDANAIQNSIVNAKGDLIGASANDVPAILSVGSNGETLVADSSTATGLRYTANFAAGKNKILNGDFSVWQRGASFTNPASLAYTADRYAIFYDGTGATRTISQQTFTPGTAPVAGYEGKYFYRYAVSVAGTSNTANLLRQYIEDVRTLAGQTVTVSFWAKAASSLTIPTIAFTQNFGTGGSPSAGLDTTIATSVAVTTSWQRFTYTVSVPSLSGKTIGTNNDSALELRFFLPSGASTFTFDTWGWQVEAGSVATAFQTATGTLQGELAACQRYYQRITTTTTFGRLGFGMATGTTNCQVIFPLKQTMRTSVTALDFSGNTHFVMNDGVSNTATNAAPTLDSMQNPDNCLVIFTAASGLTQFRPYNIAGNNNATAFIGFSAEL